MRMTFPDISVRRLADVPALCRVLHEPFPREFQHLQDVPLGNGLLDPPGQNRGGVLRATSSARANRIAVDAFVRSKEGDAGLFEFVLDLRAVVGRASDPLNGLADDRDEPPVRPLGLREKVSDAAVARHRDVEGLVGVALTAQVQERPARFDVVEVSHDHEAGRQLDVHAVQLTRDRERGILPVLGRSTGKEGDWHDRGDVVVRPVLVGHLHEPVKDADVHVIGFICDCCHFPSPGLSSRACCSMAHSRASRMARACIACSFSPSRPEIATISRRNEMPPLAELLPSRSSIALIGDRSAACSSYIPLDSWAVASTTLFPLFSQRTAVR
ncbi:hypothetical protein ACFOZ4_08630 [Hamadaea flava]|uniref:Uncharacterized protein n=1 Tax=Hamadaea flava TaxID=1742688 RepID=A0ABV8LK54_9ACTN|nr:hypothetical protein [Hamadaea flava]